MENKKLLVDVNTAINAIDEYMKNVYDCPLSEIVEYQRSCQDTKCIYIVQGLCEATEIIKDAPTVDAVEVVRCMNCTMAENSEYNRIVWCTKHKCRKLYMDFCSKGDRTDEPVYMRGAKMDGGNEDGQ